MNRSSCFSLEVSPHYHIRDRFVSQIVPVDPSGYVASEMGLRSWLAVR
jgi:hypothetical protein